MQDIFILRNPQILGCRFLDALVLIRGLLLYGNTNTKKLLYISTQLKQGLKIECHKLKNRKTIQERRYINRMFKEAPKKVYRSMKGENSGPVKDMPTKQNVQDFWGRLWGTQVQHEIDTPWIETLRDEYCRNAEQNNMKLLMKYLTRFLAGWLIASQEETLFAESGSNDLKAYTNHLNKN